MIGLTGQECGKCGLKRKTLSRALFVPGLSFEFLEGKPFVCEKCVAAVFGIEADWVAAVANELQVKEVVKN